MESVKIYRAVMYLRLSKDDSDVSTFGKTESNSIANQKSLIRDYAESRKDIKLCREYVDDGYSGVSFERPAFLAMLADIKEGKYDCVIVKDLSRFGRDYIEAGRYIEKIFPALGIRFIAINDNYDSMSRDNGSNRIYVPFRNFINDSYCRDTSIKIRSHLDIKRKQGEFIGAFAVYGYLKSEENNNRLLIDEYAAGVVREIFDLKLQGLSQAKIAELLNEKGEPSPMEYKKLMGISYQTTFKKNLKAKWTAVAVGRILQNEIYTGVMVQGKRTTPNHKVKMTVVKPKEEWIRVEQTHDPIIQRECFETVQGLLIKDLRVAPGGREVYLFSGLLICGGCGEALIRKINRSGGKEYVYYICATNRNKGECEGRRISEKDLEKSVFLLVKKQIEAVVELDGLLQNINISALNKIKARQLEAKLALLMEELHTCRKLKLSLYENLVKGILDREEYETYGMAYRNREKELEDAIHLRHQEMEECRSQKPDDNKWIQELKEYRNIRRLDRKMLVRLVDRIIVHEKKYVEIICKCRDEFEELLQLAEESMGSDMPKDAYGYRDFGEVDSL